MPCITNFVRVALAKGFRPCGSNSTRGAEDYSKDAWWITGREEKIMTSKDAGEAREAEPGEREGSARSPRRIIKLAEPNVCDTSLHRMCF